MFVVSTPVGENLTRLPLVVFPVMLMTALSRGFPAALAHKAVALSAALVYNSRRTPEPRSTGLTCAPQSRTFLGAGSHIPRRALDA